MKEERKRILKKRTKLSLPKGKRLAKTKNDRLRYCTSSWDTYSADWGLGLTISNALYQYVADAKNAIERDDWDVIEKHADAIKAFATADSWDEINEKSDVRWEYKKKEIDFRAAMFWLSENWHRLWW